MWIQRCNSSFYHVNVTHVKNWFPVNAKKNDIPADTSQLATQPRTHIHTKDSARATHSHSWLIYTAAIQMRIAEDVWWFSNLCSCHREMGRADPCHPHSESQTAPHLHLNLPPLTISVHHCVVHLLSKCQDECSAAASPHIPRMGVTCSTATWYNVTLPLGKDPTLTCYVEFTSIQQEKRRLIKTVLKETKEQLNW